MSTFGVSWACAATPKMVRKANRDTTSFNFMLSSSEFSCARSSAGSMRGWALGGVPQAGRQRSAFPFLSAHRDAATAREVVGGVKYFLCVYAADYSRGCTLCRELTDRIGASVKAAARLCNARSHRASRRAGEAVRASRKNQRSLPSRPPCLDKWAVKA